MVKWVLVREQNASFCTITPHTQCSLLLLLASQDTTGTHGTLNTAGSAPAPGKEIKTAARAVVHYQSSSYSNGIGVDGNHSKAPC